MKKIQIIIFALFFLISPAATLALDQEAPVYITVFYGQGCPHCENEKIFLDKLSAESPNLSIRYLEVWSSQENRDLMLKVADSLNVQASGVPLTVVGNYPILGYNSDATTGQQIRNLVEEYFYWGSEDYADESLKGTLSPMNISLAQVKEVTGDSALVYWQNLMSSHGQYRYSKSQDGLSDMPWIDLGVFDGLNTENIYGSQVQLDNLDAQTSYFIEVRKFLQGGSSIAVSLPRRLSFTTVYNPLSLKPAQLIKNKKYAEVFFVDDKLCLHWIINEIAARKYFGSTWNRPGNIMQFDSIPAGYKFCPNLE